MRGGTDRLFWPNGNIYYSYCTSLSNDTRSRIDETIQKIENFTCLRFYLSSSRDVHDLIEFASEGDKCASSVGRIGGIQRTILSESCTVVHEICLALGMWDEDYPPHRENRYIILGELYKHMFNDGHLNLLNKMYSCPDASSDYAILELRDIRFIGFPALATTDGTQNYYIRVTAVVDKRLNFTESVVVRGNIFHWKFDFGLAKWQYFEISVIKLYGEAPVTLHPDLRYNYEPVTGNQAFSLTRYDDNPYMLPRQRHCVTGDGNQYQCVIFNYIYAPDGNECSPNPCRRGHCIDRIVNYWCNCPSVYEGRNCDFRASGKLVIYIKSGSGLPDRGGWPYVKVTAVRSGSISESLSARTQLSDTSSRYTYSTNVNPSIDRYFSFELSAWTHFYVTVYNYNGSVDNIDKDALSNTTTYNLDRISINTYSEQKFCYSGYILFDYWFLERYRDIRDITRGSGNILFVPFG